MDHNQQLGWYRSNLRPRHRPRRSNHPDIWPDHHDGIDRTMCVDIGRAGECVSDSWRPIPLDQHLGTQALESRTSESSRARSHRSRTDRQVELLLWRDQRIRVDSTLCRNCHHRASADSGHRDLLEPFVCANAMASIPAVPRCKFSGPGV
jgi:hypothetical protein